MKIKNIIKYLPAVIFCGFIFAFALFYFVSPKLDYSAQEKRKLSDFPEFTLEKLADGTFQSGIDDYLSDHITARNFFVGFSAEYELVTGRNGSKGIYLGSDSYLFPKPTKDSEILSQNAEYINEYAEYSSIPVYMTVIPSTGYINSDKLPFNHEEYKDNELISSFKNKLSENIKFIDVTEAFKEKAKSEQLYYKTDHHWTSKGAFECYKLLGNAMGYEPVDESEFSVETIDGFYGTSYSKSALWTLPPDKIELWSRKNQPEDSVSVEISDGREAISSDSYFFREQLKNDDKYPVFLDGNHSLVRIKNSNAKGGRLIVVKDSYAHAAIPFLSQNYSEIIMVDLRYYKKDVSALVEDEKADAILLLYSIDNLATDKNLAYLY